MVGVLEVINRTELRVRPADLGRWQDAPAGDAEIEKKRAIEARMLEELVPLVEPAAAFCLLTISEVSDDGVALIGGLGLSGSEPATNFREAFKVAAAICTLGSAVDRRIAELRAENDHLGAMVLDRLANTAVNQVGKVLQRTIEERALDGGLKAGAPLTPGTRGWDGTSRQEVLGMVPAVDLGVVLGDNGTYDPAKSMLFVVGLTPITRMDESLSACDTCTVGDSCPFKIV